MTTRPVHLIYICISTHVSARKRTPKKTTESCSCLFQFTSPYGDEPGYSLQAVPDVKFQFTSPYGDELDACDQLMHDLRHFNSRLLTETNSEKNQYA